MDPKNELPHSFVFWFFLNKPNILRKVPGQAPLNYEENINQICAFRTVEDFWGYYQHMVRPEQLPTGTDFFLFQEGIKPMWEDPANKNGGRMLLKIKKSFGNKFWEDLILNYIGDLSNHTQAI